MKRTLTLALAGMLVLGLALPMALAKPDERPDRTHRADSASERQDRLPGEAAQNHSKGNGSARESFEISLTASGTDQDNESWTIKARGLGLAKAKSDNGSLEALRGFARMHIELFDENGTLVKNGTIRVRLLAFENETGEWKWRLVSVGKTPRGMPKLHLRGDNVTVEDGSAVLEGQGFAVVKPAPDDHRRKIKLDEATVEISR